MVDKIYLSSPHMSEEAYEQFYVEEAFKSNWIAPLGENVDAFEREIATRTGSKYAVALSSGTAAMHMALIAAGVTRGDVVFCQSLTFAATANPIIYQGATPVFVDSDYKTWNMCPNALEEAFRMYPQAKVVVIVHLYGLSADIDKIKAICDKHGAVLIEDAAEALGTTYKGQQTGTFGICGVLSYNSNKIITTSSGGMLLTNSEQTANKVRFWSTQSKDKARYYQHSELGFNYRMSNVLAGIGRGQLNVLDIRIKKKKAIFEFYRRELGALEGLEFMPINEWNDPNIWLSCIILKGKVRPLDIILALEENNIEARPIWKPMHLQPFFEHYGCIGGAVSEYLFENGVCLPSDTKVSEDDLMRICNIIRALW